MSRTMVVYFTAALASWAPAALALREPLRGTISERMLCALLLAVVWPLAVPALTWTTLQRRPGASRSAHAGGQRVGDDRIEHGQLFGEHVHRELGPHSVTHLSSVRALTPTRTTRSSSVAK